MEVKKWQHQEQQYKTKVASLGPSAARADRKKLEIADELVRLGANIAPLTRMSRMTGKKAVGNQKYTILEDGDRPRTDTTNGWYTDSRYSYFNFIQC